MSIIFALILLAVLITGLSCLAAIAGWLALCAIELPRPEWGIAWAFFAVWLLAQGLALGLGFAAGTVLP